MKFPEDFLWGGSVTAGWCGDIRNAEEDIALFARKGMQCLRIFIEGARIFPGGEEEEPDEEGLKFYDKILDCCKDNGLEPIVTISCGHGPHDKAAGYNSWEDRGSIEFYERYCKVLFERYKDEVKFWLIFNEINFGPEGGGPLTGEKYFQKLHNELVAGARVVRYAHVHYPDFLIGNMIGFVPVYPTDCVQQDIIAGQQKMQMVNWFCSDIQIRGEYPFYARRYFKEHSVRIKVDPLDIDDLSEGTVDFYAVSCPEGLRWSLNEIYGRYGIPIMVVENPADTGDEAEAENTTGTGGAAEAFRIRAGEMAEAVEDGIDLMGYCPGAFTEKDSLEEYSRVISSNVENE